MKYFKNDSDFINFIHKKVNGKRNGNIRLWFVRYLKEMIDANNYQRFIILLDKYLKYSEDDKNLILTKNEFYEIVTHALKKLKVDDRYFISLLENICVNNEYDITDIEKNILYYLIKYDDVKLLEYALKFNCVGINSIKSNINYISNLDLVFITDSHRKIKSLILSKYEFSKIRLSNYIGSSDLYKYTHIEGIIRNDDIIMLKKVLKLVENYKNHNDKERISGIIFNKPGNSTDDTIFESYIDIILTYSNNNKNVNILKVIVESMFNRFKDSVINTSSYNFDDIIDKLKNIYIKNNYLNNKYMKKLTYLLFKILNNTNVSILSNMLYEIQNSNIYDIDARFIFKLNLLRFKKCGNNLGGMMNVECLHLLNIMGSLYQKDYVNIFEHKVLRNIKKTQKQKNEFINIIFNNIFSKIQQLYVYANSYTIINSNTDPTISLDYYIYMAIDIIKYYDIKNVNIFLKFLVNNMTDKHVNDLIKTDKVTDISMFNAIINK